MLAAFAMWVFWILAYVTGLSNHGFYHSFHHAAGGLSAAADQQIASVVLWFVAAAAFIPRDLLERTDVAAIGRGRRHRVPDARPRRAAPGRVAVTPKRGGATPTP